MPDALDQLRQLAGDAPREPESLAGLRRRIARRRWRRRGVVGTAAVVVAMVAVAMVVSDDRGEDVRTAGDPAPTVPTTTAPSPTSTPGSSEPGPLDLPVGSVVSSAAGVDLVSTSGELTRVWDQPAASAFSLGGIVVAQGADPSSVDYYPPWAAGPIMVFEASGLRELAPGAGETFALHDAGVVGGEAVVVVTARSGINPEDTDERLLLVNLASGGRTDLGSVGGWEAGVRQARLVGDRILLLHSVEARSFLSSRSLDGSVEWGSDASGGRGEWEGGASDSIAVAGGGVLLLETSFTGASFEPQLTVTSIEVATGAEISSETLSLKLAPGVAVPGGFCFVSEWSDGVLICDQSSAGPIRIDLASGDTTLLGSLERGIVTLPRSPAQGTAVVLERDVSAWNGQLIFLMDGTIQAGGFDAWLVENEQTSAESAARLLLGLDDGDAQTESDGNTATVTLVLEVTGDDSVSGERYVVTFQLDAGRVTRLLGAEWAHRCARADDHTRFAPRLCP